MLCYILVVAWLSLAQCFATKPCQVPETAQEADWSKMGETWYDVIDMPLPPTGVDLYDWQDISVTEKGFTALIEEWTCGHEKKETFQIDFIRVRPGVYRPDPERRAGHVNATITSTSHMNNESGEIEFIDTFYSWELFFATDYESYFIPMMCSKEGWTSYIKGRGTELDLKTLVKIMNALVNMDAMGPLYLKKNECRDLQ